MADTKITALTAITTVDPAADVLPIVDVSDTSMAASGTTKKITSNQILGAGGTATLASATITGAANFNGGALAGYLNGSLMFGSSGNTVNLFAQSSGIALVNNTGTASLLFANNSGVFTFGDGAGGTRMTLNSTGLGVGDSPSYKLHVARTADGTVGYFRRIGATINPALTVYCNETGNTVGFGTDYAGAASPAITFTTAGTERLRIDATGNVGIGVTPSAWQSTFKALQSLGGAIGSNSASQYYVLQNAYINTSGGWEYTTGTTVATMFRQNSGAFEFFNASGGASPSWIQAMTLTAAGDLLVGTTAAAGSASNSTKTVGGIFSSVNGTSASTASGSAVTLFASQSEATYMVSAYVLGTGAPATYNAVAIVKTNAGVATLTTISSATNITISISGLNVQATQTSGVSQVITYNVIRIS